MHKEKVDEHAGLSSAEKVLKLENMASENRKTAEKLLELADRQIALAQEITEKEE